jgi:ubiquinone/menaquinone biosynthesis C-methylase UbiE
MSKAVHAFFSQWEIYRLCIEHNTLHHREVGEILRRELRMCSKPFSFLDLACGDAELTASVLLDTKVSSYTGVDFCAPALGLAKKHLAKLAAPQTLMEEDFATFLAQSKNIYDVVYLGLSLHHLDREKKNATMSDIFRSIAPGGCFYLYEPYLHDGETREQYVERWITAMAGPYDAFPEEARRSLQQHVSQSEQPESLSDYTECARYAGFTQCETLFRDALNFYALFRFSA